LGRRFFIIDGHAQIFRAYYAPFRELTSPRGEPTKAVFVFTQMLLNLVEQQKPDYLAMVIDHGDETVFRKELDPGYKANREPPPADFHPQEQRILRMTREIGLPVFEMPGYEADDLIATMVRKLREEGFEVILVSKDKDLRQLLGPGVVMYDVQKDETFGEDQLKAQFGYTPAQAVEVQALMGDKVDNVPGIPGVGEATAARLIAQFGTAAEVVLRAGEIKTPKLRENVAAHGSKVGLARKLVELRSDVPMPFDPEQCRFTGFDTGKLLEHLEELGFRTLSGKVRASLSSSEPSPRPDTGKQAISRSTGGLFDDLEATKPADPDRPAGIMTSEGCDYRVVRDESGLAELVERLESVDCFAFDTETDGLGALRSSLVGMSFSWEEGKGFYVPVMAPSGEAILTRERALGALRGVLENPKIGKVGHNIKYDLLAMRKAGVQVRGVVSDTMVAAFLLDAARSSYGIDSLALQLLAFRKIPTEQLIGKGKRQRSMAQVELDLIGRYAAEDADIAFRLHRLFSEKLKELPEIRRLHDEVEVPLIEVLVQMEFTGIRVDPAILKQQSTVLGERVVDLRQRIHAEAGMEFNIDSPKQLQEVLFKKLGLKPVKTTKTGQSTDVEVLEKLAGEHPVPGLILEYRSLVKLKNTYLDSLGDEINPETGRVHTSFNQIGAQTGRLSSSDPNLQNIPIRTDEGRRIRLAFVPDDPNSHRLLIADYSQIELRILAHFTQEPALVQAFEADQDIHRAVAAEVFGVGLEEVTRDQRAQAKTINFGIIYGISAYGLSRRIDGMTVPMAQALIDSYNRRFPGIGRFMSECVEKAKADGYVETILGRRRPIREISSPVLAIRNAGERIAINSVIQGSAADLIKVAMVNLHRRLERERRPSRMLLQVHDELVFETPVDAIEADSRIVREEMTRAMQLRVPLRVDIGVGLNWGEAK
jgi:DNA polymerase-1